MYKRTSRLEKWTGQDIQRRTCIVLTHVPILLAALSSFCCPEEEKRRAIRNARPVLVFVVVVCCCCLPACLAATTATATTAVTTDATAAASHQLRDGWPVCAKDSFYLFVAALRWEEIFMCHVLYEMCLNLITLNVCVHASSSSLMHSAVLSSVTGHVKCELD